MLLLYNLSTVDDEISYQTDSHDLTSGNKALDSLESSNSSDEGKLVCLFFFNNFTNTINRNSESQNCISTDRWSDNSDRSELSYNYCDSHKDFVGGPFLW